MCNCDEGYRCNHHDLIQDMHDFLSGIEQIPVVEIIVDRPYKYVDAI